MMVSMRIPQDQPLKFRRLHHRGGVGKDVVALKSHIFTLLIHKRTNTLTVFTRGRWRKNPSNLHTSCRFIFVCLERLDLSKRLDALSLISTICAPIVENTPVTIDTTLYIILLQIRRIALIVVCKAHASSI